MKKNLLKITSLAVAAMLAAVSLTGCGAKEEAEQPEDGGKKVITMATNPEFPPFEYLEGEEMVGAEIDMINAIADYLDYEVEMTNIDFDAVLTGVATGKYDLGVSGITATDERRQNMNFSDPYYKASQAIIVKAGSEIKTAADVEGKSVGCQEGTTGEQYLLDGNYNVQSFKTGSEAVTALIAGKLDAVVIDDAVAKALAKEQGEDAVVLDEALTKEEYAIALQLGNDELTEEINTAIAALKEDGTLKNIFAKYDLSIDD